MSGALIKDFSTMRGTLMPPSHWAVSCKSVRFRRSECDRIDCEGTTNWDSGIAAGNCWSTCRSHKLLVQNLAGDGWVVGDSIETAH